MALLDSGAGDKGGAEGHAESQETPQPVNSLVCRVANVGAGLVARDDEGRQAEPKVTEAREQTGGVIAHGGKKNYE